MDIQTPFTGTYPSGKILQLTAPASFVSGGRTYVFSKWEDNSTNRVRTVTITAPSTFTATYVIVPQFTLTTVAGTGGTVSPSSGVYDQGTVVPLQATPSPDYNFAGWSGDVTGSTNPTTITMNTNHAVQANFTPKQVTLNVVAGANGTVNPAGTFSLDINGVYDFTATPNSTPYPGYQFDHWDLNGANLGSTTTLSLKITASMNNGTLTALFTANAIPTITLTVARVGAGTVNPYGSVTLNVDPNNPSTFTATDVAGSGMTFDHWEFSYDPIQIKARSISIIITQAMQGTTITAVFVPILYNVTINSAPLQGVTITVTEMN